MQEVQTDVQSERGKRSRDGQDDANSSGATITTATTATEVVTSKLMSEMLLFGDVTKWAIGRYHVDKKTGASWGLDKRTAVAFLTFVHLHMSQHQQQQQAEGDSQGIGCRSKQGFCTFLLSSFFFKMVHMYNRVAEKFVAKTKGSSRRYLHHGYDSFQLNLHQPANQRGNEFSGDRCRFAQQSGHLGSLAWAGDLAKRHISRRRDVHDEKQETDTSGRLCASQLQLQRTGYYSEFEIFLSSAFTNNQIDAVSVILYWFNLGPLEDWGFLLGEWPYRRQQQPIPMLKLALDYHLPGMAKLMFHYLPSSPESITRNLRSCLTSVKDSVDDVAAKDEEGLLTVVRDLIENHIDNPERDQEESSARAAAVLQAAAAGGSFLLFQYLAEKALHPGGRDYKQGKELSDFRDELGGNLAHTAATHERLRILRHLFETRGFDPEATDTKGLTAFQYALKLRNGEVARFFLGTVYTTTKGGEKMTSEQLKAIIQPLEPETNPGAALSWAYSENLFLLTG